MPYMRVCAEVAYARYHITSSTMAIFFRILNILYQTVWNG